MSLSGLLLQFRNEVISEADFFTQLRSISNYVRDDAEELEKFLIQCNLNQLKTFLDVTQSHIKLYQFYQKVEYTFCTMLKRASSEKQALQKLAFIAARLFPKIATQEIVKAYLTNISGEELVLVLLELNISAQQLYQLLTEGQQIKSLLYCLHRDLISYNFIDSYLELLDKLEQRHRETILTRGEVLGLVARHALPARLASFVQNYPSAQKLYDVYRNALHSSALRQGLMRGDLLTIILSQFPENERFQLLIGGNKPPIAFVKDQLSSLPVVLFLLSERDRVGVLDYLIIQIKNLSDQTKESNLWEAFVKELPKEYLPYVFARMNEGLVSVQVLTVVLTKYTETEGWDFVSSRRELIFKAAMENEQIFALLMDSFPNNTREIIRNISFSGIDPAKWSIFIAKIPLSLRRAIYVQPSSNSKLTILECIVKTPALLNTNIDLFPSNVLRLDVLRPLLSNIAYSNNWLNPQALTAAKIIVSHQYQKFLHQLEHTIKSSGGYVNQKQLQQFLDAAKLNVTKKLNDPILIFENVISDSFIDEIKKETNTLAKKHFPHRHAVLRLIADIVSVIFFPIAMIHKYQTGYFFTTEPTRRAKIVETFMAQNPIIS